MIGLVLSNLAILAVAMTGLWALSVLVKDASIVDIAWGPACAAPALLTFIRVDGATPRALLITALVAIWALRLAAHLGRRSIGHGEDFRYVKMREQAGSDAAFARWSFVFVFMLQCAVAWFVSLPTQIGQMGPDTPLGPLAYAGVAIFGIGLAFEAIGDFQLARFKANPENKGRLLTSGLWGLTRHPNYFG
ncbi:MAG: DUF1295 domain-containing protein, partial [Pseudomonadota bacterium]